jgi:hypothetical protein
MNNNVNILITNNGSALTVSTVMHNFQVFGTDYTADKRGEFTQ